MIHFRVLNRLEKLGGKGVEPYLKAFEMTASGPSIAEIQLMFEAVREIHIRESVLEPSDDLNTLPVSQIPRLMEALGAFPSKEEVIHFL